MSQHAKRLSRRRMLAGSGATLAALSSLGGSLIGTAHANPASGPVQVYLPLTATPEQTAKPTIVLVHGAWADSNSWAKVIRKLQDDAYTVVAPPVALQSVAADVASVHKVVASINGPVLMAGHSYGGAVMTGAATGLTNVKGLVYIAAYAPDKGETTLGLNGQFDAQFGPSKLGTVLRPDGALDDPATVIYLDTTLFPSVFATGVEAEEAAIMAVTQRPPAGAGFVEPFPVEPAWKSFPTWYQVSAGDQVIQPDGQRFMAKRMGATIIELDAGHTSLVSHARDVTRFIKQAAAAVMA